ncbi:MAG: ketoacyl-ACP synthase III [Lachnospiraceae bacterium]|nr:ketoacyl-ACP synthase III [Lachnospiraceae bacterium]MDY3729539.1 beta-ketoacyl-ACP synthase III [Candidatus Choladocola sp.]
MTGVIAGTGSYVPSYVMDNNKLSEFVDTSDEWIKERTGVARRHIVADETTSFMAAEAAKKAVEDADLTPDQIDLILVSTISSDVILPCTACEVQRILGAVNATCFDLNAACTGFVLAYNTANAYIQSGVYKNALVIGSESLSNLTNWKDRGTCILFGDGAGAVVLTAEEKASYVPATHSEGAKGEALTLKSRHDSNGITKEIEPNRMMDAEYFMQMDGQAVFKFAVKKVPEAILEVLDKNNIKKEDIDCYLLHQANRRIVEAVAKRMGEPIEKFPMNLQEYGNTSSASIPILLDELSREGKLKSGKHIVLAGFGAGLTWGASIMDWK